MKIALAHDFLTVYGGAERVLKELHLMYPEAPIFTAVADPTLVAKHFPKADIRTSWLNNSWRRRINQIFLMNMPRAIESLDFTGFNVVLSSSGAFAHGIITGPETHHICYCHSPMRYAWDWHAEFLRERGLDKGWLKPFIANTMMNKLRTWDAISASRVDTWIANSLTVQARIKHYYRADSVVINPPVDTDFFDPAKLEPGVKRGEHALTVSRLSVTKKIDHMIGACAAAKLPLRIAGTGDDAPFRQMATSLKADVTFLGEIGEEEKRTALAEASIFLFAAEDDFGIAPVEAMAMGTPVIAFGKGGATETVVHGSTGLLYPEHTAEALADAIEQWQKHGLKGSAESIRHHALKFSTEKFRKAIEELVGKHA